MPAEVLRAGVHNPVRAVVEGILERGRRKGCVNRQYGASIMRALGVHCDGVRIPGWVHGSFEVQEVPGVDIGCCVQVEDLHSREARKEVCGAMAAVVATADEEALRVDVCKEGKEGGKTGAEGCGVPGEEGGEGGFEGAGGVCGFTRVDVVDGGWLREARRLGVVDVRDERGCVTEGGCHVDSGGDVGERVEVVRGVDGEGGGGEAEVGEVGGEYFIGHCGVCLLENGELCVDNILDILELLVKRRGR